MGYRPGASPRWALLRRYDIPDLLDPTEVYLTRWRLVQTPWFGVLLHCIRRPDHDRHLHDHPWPFVSIILRGGYVERRARNVWRATMHAAGHPNRARLRTRRPGSIARMRRGEFHAIEALRAEPTWTLVLAGRRSNGWGYATEHGFVDSDQYHHDRNPDGFEAPPCGSPQPATGHSGSPYPFRSQTTSRPFSSTSTGGAASPHRGGPER